MAKGDTSAANAARAEQREGLKVTKEKFASLVGRSVSWVEKKLRAGMPAHFSGGPGRPTKIDTAKAFDYLIERAKTLAEDKFSGGGSAANDPDHVSDGEARRRINAAKAELEELKLRKLQGEVAEIAVMEATLKNAITTTRKLLLALAPSLAPELALKTNAGEIQQDIETSIHEALHELQSINTADFVTGTVLQSMGSATDTNG